MGKGIFITGTDTGVGKTYLAEGLIRAFRERGLRVCPMKPAETGCRVSNGKLVPGDTVRLVRASGVDEPLDLINSYRFRRPLAPSVASRIEGIAIDRKRIISSYKRLKEQYDMVVVEGAGGIMVPLSDMYLFLDLIRDLHIPLVITARPGLGTINHTLLTVASAVNKKLNVLGVVINYTVKKRRGPAEKTNPAVIEKLGGAPILGTVPYLRGASLRRRDKIFSEIAENVLLRLCPGDDDLDPSVFHSP